MPLASGKLRHRVRIEYPVEVQNQTTGAITTTWATLATVWAEIRPMSARDLLVAQVEDSKITGRITIRYRNDITESMRLVHVSKGDVYNIEGLLSDPDSGLEYITIPVSEGVRWGDE